MRRADRIIRDRHSRIPDKYKKIDTTVNGDVESLAEQHKEMCIRDSVCALWLDGIAGSLDWFYPDVKCFEKNTRDGKVQN